MENMNFLDKNGLKYFWEKIKKYISDLLYQPRYSKPYQATYDGLGNDVTNITSYQHALYTVMIPELGDNPTAEELDGLYFRVHLPEIPAEEEGASKIGYYALRVNNSAYWPIRVLNGTYSNITAILPFYNMLSGHTVPVSMLVNYDYGTTHMYYSQFILQDYIKPYGSTVVGNAWTVSKGGTGATNAENARKNLEAAAAPTLTTVTLSANGWSNKAQDVSVPGVTADETEQLIQIIPAKVSVDAYESSRVSCWSQTTNKLTFIYEASSKPTEDLTVYVVVQPL